MKFSTVSGLSLAITASTVSASAVWMKPCYNGDNCATYQYNGGSEWNNGGCYNFPQGMASYEISDEVQQCLFYNKNNCDESGSVLIDTTGYEWFNSNVGWLWSMRCRAY